MVLTSQRYFNADKTFFKKQQQQQNNVIACTVLCVHYVQAD